MTIVFQTAKQSFSCKADPQDLLDRLAIKAGVFLDRRCGGKGVCRRCLVTIGPGTYEIQGQKIEVAAGHTLKVMACQTRVIHTEAPISVSATSILERKGKIGVDFLTGEFSFSARTRKICIKVPRVANDDPIPDCERLTHEITRHTGLKSIITPLKVLCQLPEILTNEHHELTVTLSWFNQQWFITDLHEGDTTCDNYAVVVDIGTTTVACALVDLTDGGILGKASRYNQQITLADDVASRISLCTGQDQVEHLRQLVIEQTINPLIDELCQQADISAQDVHRLVISGNTVMSHLFLGLSPIHIGRLPFQPVINQHNQYWANSLGLRSHAWALVDVVPSISGYIGGDITSDIYVSKLNQRKGISLLLDIGTNGEIVLCEDGRMWVAATAAGPAFEGAGLHHGCRATDGAIEHVAFSEDGVLSYSVIGRQAPLGICGSAIIDFIAVLYRAGWIGSTGRYDIDLLCKHGCYLSVDLPEGPAHACLLASVEESSSETPIFVTEKDIAEVLKAKAAISAGIKTLLSMRDKSVQDLDRLILAGGFARYIHLVNAMDIGLLPRLPIDRFEVIGNGSLAGAYLAVVDEHACPAFCAIVKEPETIMLNLQDDFEDHYIDGLLLEE